MYTVYVDDKLLYSPLFGLDKGYAILDAKITTEINRGGSFEFKMAANHVLYNQMQTLKSSVKILKDSKEVWRGRILSTNTDFYKTKTVFCEGIMSYLVDAITEPYSYENITVEKFFALMLNVYNSFASDYRKIQAGVIAKTLASQKITVVNEDYSTVFDELTGVLVEQLGGYIRPRFENGDVYLDYTESVLHVNNQTIQFGKNLIDLDQYIDATEVFTVLTPLGGQNENGDTVTIASVNNGKKYITSTAGVNAFGNIGHVETFSDITDPSELLKKAKEFLDVSIQMAVSIEIEAFDLHLLDVSTNDIEVGTQIRVYSVPHGIDNYFEVSKTTVYLSEPDKNSYTLGSSLTTLTDQSLKNIKSGDNVIEMIRAANSKSSKAISENEKTVQRIDDSVLEITVKGG